MQLIPLGQRSRDALQGHIQVPGAVEIEADIGWPRSGPHQQFALRKDLTIGEGSAAAWVDKFDEEGAGGEAGEPAWNERRKTTLSGQPAHQLGWRGSNMKRRTGIRNIQ